MPILTSLAFVFLSSALLILWFNRSPKIWGTLVCLSWISGLIAGHISGIGLVFIIGLTLLWIIYDRHPSTAVFLAIICLSISLKLRFIPGYYPFFVTPKFALGLENPLIGLFPLALLVPLAKNRSDWRLALHGLFVGAIGICLLAFLAIVSGSISLNFALPSHAALRIISNLILTCIPEEAFYRGFIQQTLTRYFKNTRTGKAIALFITSLLFAATHIFWAPNLGILVFTFLASLLYGTVYLFSNRIESAIFCHFLLNFIHMTFFSYHAT